MRTRARIKIVKKGCENYALKIWESRINIIHFLDSEMLARTFMNKLINIFMITANDKIQ